MDVRVNLAIILLNSRDGVYQKCSLSWEAVQSRNLVVWYVVESTEELSKRSLAHMKAEACYVMLLRDLLMSCRSGSCFEEYI